jgi:lipid A 3-O-deacylase
MKSRFLCIILAFWTSALFAMRCEPPLPLVAIGGGYWHAGNHSDGLIQAEYKFDKYYYKVIRPQVSLIIPEFRAAYVGAGIAVELYLGQHVVFSPNFEPGLYYQGGGRKLGFPLEFRSALELAYEFENGARIGSQLYHISNASLGRHNPGANALTFFIAIPFAF